MTVKTVRLVNQQWQGGMDENYSFGARLLSHIVPPTYSDQTETIFTPVSTAAHSNSQIKGAETVLKQQEATLEILNAKEPANVLTLGGDCSISAAPFEYLHSKYPENLGLIWLDSHPDLGTATSASHVRELALANLMGEGIPQYQATIKHPFQPENVLLAGIDQTVITPVEQERIEQLDLQSVSPAQLLEKSDAITNWIKQHGFTKVVVHTDFDILSPSDFHANFAAAPADRRIPGVAVGSLQLNQMLRLFNDIAATTEIVGLTLAEHMPWDALRLRQGLAALPIFE